MGADDYLTKPFGIEELLARERVALRHSSRMQGAQSKVVNTNSITIDLAFHYVKCGDEEIKLLHALGFFGLHQRDLQIEGTSRAKLTLHPNFASMAFGDRLDNRQSQTRAAL